MSDETAWRPRRSHGNDPWAVSSERGQRAPRPQTPHVPSGLRESPPCSFPSSGAPGREDGQRARQGPSLSPCPPRAQLLPARPHGDACTPSDLSPLAEGHEPNLLSGRAPLAVAGGHWQRGWGADTGGGAA